MFIERLDTEPSAIRSQKKYFPELPDWSNCFVDIYKSSKDDKLRQFFFKVMLGIIPTKKELMKYKLTTDDKGPLCLNSGSIEHTFINCQESTDFSTKTLGWFYVFHKTKIKLSNRQIVFNTFEDSSPLRLSNPLKSSDFIAKEIFVQLQEHYKETKSKR